MMTTEGEMKPATMFEKACNEQILNSSPILHEAGSLMGRLCSKNTHIHVKSLEPNIYSCNTFSFVYWLKS